MCSLMKNYFSWNKNDYSTLSLYYVCVYNSFAAGSRALSINGSLIAVVCTQVRTSASISRGSGLLLWPRIHHVTCTAEIQFHHK